MYVLDGFCINYKNKPVYAWSSNFFFKWHSLFLKLILHTFYKFLMIYYVSWSVGIDQISHYTSNCVKCQNCMHLFGGFTIYSSDKVACRVRPILALEFYITYSKYLTMNVMKIVFECSRNMLSYVNKSEKFSSFYRR